MPKFSFPVVKSAQPSLSVNPLELPLLKSDDLLREDMNSIITHASAILDMYNLKVSGEVKSTYGAAQEISIRSSFLISSIERIKNTCNYVTGADNITPEDLATLQIKMSKISKRDLLKILVNNGY